MAGNFHGVLIFVIFVVDLAVMKFSHPQKLMPTMILWYYICESMMMGVATNIVAARPTLSSIASKVPTIIQLLRHVILFYLMLFVTVA